MDTLKRYNKFINGVFSEGAPFSFENKEDNAFTQILYMLSRTQSMFTWSGLPDTVPQRMVELYLQINGNVAFTEYKGDLYAMRGGLGGTPDAYYMPTVYTVANPALDWSANLKIGAECIVIPNDSLYLGLMPLFKRYAHAMAENELSISLAIINSRIIDLISAGDDRTRKSAEKFLDDIRDGKLGVISSNEFLDGIKATPYGSTANTNAITNLIEMEQYLKASWFNELGLNANYNMKRESLNSEESQLNNDALLPLVDDMLNQRKLGAEAVNALYGTNITVDFASSWKDNIEEIALEQKALDPDGYGSEEGEKGGNDGNENIE